MAGKKRVAKKKGLGQLAAAFAFLNLAWGDSTQGSHCWLEMGEASAFNLVVAAGTKIEEDLVCCPHMGLMFEAMMQCSDEYAITQLGDTKILVRSGEFQAYVPCVRVGSLQEAAPDKPIAKIDDRLKDALVKLAKPPFLAKTADTVLEQSIQLCNNTCYVTNRSVFLEAWHGNELPNGLLIPKAIVSALKNAKRPLEAFGFSDKTATFYFADGSWLRTQLFQAKWPPNAVSILNCNPTVRPVPPALFEAADKVSPFSSDAHVYVKDGLISSHPFDAVQSGSSLRLPIGSEHQERSYNINDLRVASRFAEFWDETAREDATYFQGDQVRGILVHHKTPEKESKYNSSIDDDDIPF